MHDLGSFFNFHSPFTATSQRPSKSHMNQDRTDSWQETSMLTKEMSEASIELSYEYKHCPQTSWIQRLALLLSSTPWLGKWLFLLRVSKNTYFLGLFWSRDEWNASSDYHHREGSFYNFCSWSSILNALDIINLHTDSNWKSKSFKVRE